MTPRDRASDPVLVESLDATLGQLMKDMKNNILRLMRRNAELEAAIRKHRDDVWGIDHLVGHAADVDLYSVLREAGGGKETPARYDGRLPYLPDDETEDLYDYGPVKEDR